MTEIISVGGFELEFIKGDYIAKRIIENNDFYDIANLSILKNYLNEDDIVYDIGANVGNHTIYMSQYVNKIISFEPIKVTYKMLLENIKRNKIKNVECYNFGISSSCSKVPMSINNENLGASKIDFSADGNHFVQTYNFSTIKKLIHNEATVLKIDVEGFELEVLCTLINNINFKKINLIYIECIPSTIERVSKIIEDEGYSLIKKDGNLNLVYVRESRCQK